MNKIPRYAAALILSAFLVATAHAAPASAPSKPGLSNTKKAQQAKRERDNKVRAVKKQAYAARQQAQMSGKSIR